MVLNFLKENNQLVPNLVGHSISPQTFNPLAQKSLNLFNC